MAAEQPPTTNAPDLDFSSRDEGGPNGSEALSERRIVVPSPEEVELFAPSEGDDAARLHDSRAFEMPEVTVEEFVLPERQWPPDVIVLQDWVTIAGRSGSLIPQDESRYVEFLDYQDIAVFLEVRRFTADQAFAVETSPAKIDGFFRSMVTVNPTASGVFRRLVRWSTAAVPPARWIRWRTGNLFSDWSVTFRVTLRGLRAARRFAEQPPDWIALRSVPPPRELVRVVRPRHIHERQERPDLGPDEELVHYSDEDENGADLPPDVRARLIRSGAWRPHSSSWDGVEPRGR